MTVNLSAPFYQLTINGVDCSDNLVEFKVNDGKLGDGDGLLLCQGSLILQGTPDLDIDGRSNPGQWARGNLITLDIQGDDGTYQRHPRGHQRILMNAYDPETYRQTLTIGDELSLRSIERPPGDDSGVKMGEFRTRTEIANSLLRADGLPALYDSIPDWPINYPLPRSGGSRVAQVGAIAHDAGYFVWVDGQGRIRATRIDLKPPVRLYLLQVGKDDVRYRRVSGVEAPAERVRCTGVVRQLIPYLDEQDDFQEQRGPLVYNQQGDIAQNQVLLQVRTRVRVNRMNRTVFSQRWEYRPTRLTLPKYYGTQPFNQVLQSGYVDELKSYEQGPTAPPPPVDPLNPPPIPPNPNNKGRLLSVERRLGAQYGVIYGEWLKNNSQAEQLAIATGLIPFITNSRWELEEFRYAIPPAPIPPDAPPTPTLLMKVETYRTSKTTWQPLGNLLPKEAKAIIPFSVEVAKTMSSLEVEVYSEKGRTSYLDPSLKQSLILASPDTVKNANPALTAATQAALAEVPQLPQTSNSGQLQPPAPETFPAPYDVEERQAKADFFLKPRAGTFQERARTYEIQHLVGEDSTRTSEPERQLKAIAQIKAGLLVGRYDGCIWATGWHDEFFDYQPMARLDAWEKSGACYSNLMENVSWQITPTQHLVGGEGVWVGTVPGTSTPTVPGVPFEPDAPIIPNYIVNEVVEVGLGFGAIALTPPIPAPRQYPPNWYELSAAQWEELNRADWLNMGPPLGAAVGLGFGVSVSVGPVQVAEVGLGLGTRVSVGPAQIVQAGMGLGAEVTIV